MFLNERETLVLPSQAKGRRTELVPNERGPVLLMFGALWMGRLLHILAANFRF